ncbi:unnamed protein product [Prunus brigantina]
MSMTEIDNMVRELGYDGVISYWYSIPIYSNGVLTKLNDDQDVIDMLVFVPETRLIDIFLHHGVDSNEGWFYSQSGSNMFVDVEANIVPNRGVVIEEVDDNYGAIVLVDVELDSEEYDFDNVQPKYDSDDDTPMTDRWPEFNPATDMADPEFEVGMKFSDCKVFRAAMREQFIKRNRDVIFYEKTLQVKKYKGEHTCGIVWENPTVKSSWLSAKYMETLKSNPSWPVSSFMETVEKDYNTGVSRQQVYRAKERALRQIEGIYTKQYSRIWDYCEELRKTNLGTTTKVQCDFNEQLVHPVFQRLYVCLGACKAGFIAGCISIIGLDGCLLKGVYGGQFLAAVGIDANNETWVIAYAVVESECKESWVWFLELLVKDVEIVNQFGYTFISDKQKGLLPAFEQVVPNSEHRFCARHLFTNFRLQFKGKALSDKFWGAAKATIVPQFSRQMEELKNLDMDAYTWLTEPRKPPRHWSLSHFCTHVKCDMLLNNMCESFNSFILACRDKPILTILEIVRCKLMKRIQSRRDKMKNWTKEICPKIFKKVEINKAKASGCVTMWSGGGKFQVGSGGISQYIVNLDLRTCSCREWDLTGWHCVHGVAIINFQQNYNGGSNVMDYVDACYHTQTYFKAYENLILPMNGMELWDITNMPPCVPPSYSKQPGRPRNARRKEAGESSNKANVVTKVQDSLSLLFVVSSQQTTQTSEAGPSTKTRRAKPAKSMQKGKWKRKATNAAESSNAPPTDLAAPSSTPASGSASLATGSAPPASTEVSTGNSYLLRKRPMVVGASDLSKE